MNFSMDKLIDELRRDEGVRNKPYLDSVGISTVGVGHNLKASPLPSGWTYPLTDTQINQLLTNDITTVGFQIASKMPWVANMTDARIRVIYNMAFNLGIGSLLGFKNTLATMQAGDYTKAAEMMLQSKWATQVGVRATRLADMMRKG